MHTHEAWADATRVQAVLPKEGHSRYRFTTGCRATAIKFLSRGLSPRPQPQGHRRVRVFLAVTRFQAPTTSRSTSRAMSYEVYNPITDETGLVPTTCFREIVKEPAAPTKPIGNAPIVDQDIAYLLPPGTPVLAELVRLYKDEGEYIFHLLVHYQPDAEVRDCDKHQKRQRSHSVPPTMELSLSRTWADFTAIESYLVDAFPVEAGKTREISILPFLTSYTMPITRQNESRFAYNAAQYLESLVGLKHPREIVENRCYGDMYYNNVKLLDGEHVLRSDLVRQFFSLRPGDIVLPHGEKLRSVPKSQIDNFVDATGATTEYLGVYDYVWRSHEQVARMRDAQQTKDSKPQSGDSVDSTERSKNAVSGAQPTHTARDSGSRLRKIRKKPQKAEIS